MLLRMLGGFVLVRLVSWLLIRLHFTRSAALNLFIVHAIALGLLLVLQMALRAPLGAYEPAQGVVLLPGSLLWLCYDLVALLATRPAKAGDER